jgi:beta-glucanase (GH16 family)
MFIGKAFIAFSALMAAAEAVDAPVYSGFSRTFHAAFKGAADTLPTTSMWNYALGDGNDNNELQTYTNNKANIRFSGSETLQIIPRRNAAATRGWTSARIESKATVNPPAGKLTRVEAKLRVAGNPAKNKQGMWYAFWMMGNSFRTQNKAWPACGELDLFENINGESKSHGVAHCDVYPGGVCREPEGLVTTTPLLDNQFHVWRIEIDRRNSDWKQQTLIWYADGKQYQKVTGAQINNAAIWATLAQSPFYMILNVAVGGNWVSHYFIPPLCPGSEEHKLTIDIDIHSPAPPTPTPGMAPAT